MFFFFQATRSFYCTISNHLMNKVMDTALLLSEMQTVELQLNNKLGAFVLCPSWTGDIIWTERSGDIEFSVKRPPADP